MAHNLKNCEAHRVSNVHPSCGRYARERSCGSSPTGLTNIHFRQCSANDLPFEACTFDVAIGRLSAMFFADPAAAVREALRVVLKGGYVAFAVWGPKEANPFFSTITDVLDRFVEIPPQDLMPQMHSVLPFPASWLESWNRLTLKM
ncbi:MAG: hypothetical protein DME74_11910 [Verrucomicrobia bacterium]|nr:MAG: hypothetical protein DME74_11910 [Verrucomicrobiota bacterium]